MSETSANAVTPEIPQQISAKADIKSIIIDKYIHRLSDTEMTEKYGFHRTTMYRKMKTAEAQEIRFNLLPHEFKKQVALKWSDTVNLALDTLKEKIESGKGTVGELNNVAGTGTDKLQVLTGQASSITEHRVIRADLRDLFPKDMG